ncbi:TMV resistance protein N-like [Senna tora]|uniref:TMV resistance protein N-like n=1 Tax=Senna tora TaxID=362788 RepID=A0A834W9F6_9FABA|nr:TMV resistance protein N-like [Senna tora]
MYFASISIEALLHQILLDGPPSEHSSFVTVAAVEASSPRHDLTGKESNTTQKATHSPSHRVYQNKVGNKKQEVENENEPPSRATFSNSTSRPSALDAPPPSSASTVGNPNMGPASLTTLNLRNCKNLVCLPNVIQNLRSIKIINLSGCSKCEKLSENWNENKAMEELDLSETAIKEIPSSIFLLENLKFLSFRGCKGTSPRQAWNFPIPFGWKHKLNNPSISTMLTLPSSLPSQPSLKKLDLSYCNLSDESLPKDLSNLSSLESLILKGNNFVNLPATLISNLFRLRFLSLKHCPRLQSLPQLPPNITIIRANDCASMKALLDSQLLGLIASLNSQFRMETNSIEDYFFLMIQGSEIPSWFHNENYIYVTCPKEETNLSFIADVPDYCCSSEWWGIVVCLVIHDDIASTPSSANVILFKCYPIEDEPPLKYRLGQELDPQYNSAHQLLIFFIPCYYNFHVKKLQLEFFIDSDSELQPKITKYSWCVLCKEDIEAWLQTKCEGSSINRRSENVIDIASNHIDCLNEIRVATEAAQQNQQCHEIDVKDAATTDAKQNKENSKH